MRGWLDALPPEVVRGHAQLSTSYAWCLVLAGETDGVAERLADADRALADGRDGGPMMRPAIPTQLALLRSQLAGLEGDSATAIAQARLARDLVPAGLPAEAEATLRGTAAVLLGFALVRAGDLDAAAEAYEEALPDLRAAGNRFAMGRTIARPGRDRDRARRSRACGAAVRGGARADPEGVTAATDSAAVWAVMAGARAELGQAELAEAPRVAPSSSPPAAGDAPSARSRPGDARAHRAAARGRRGRRPERRLRAGPDGPVEALTAREVEVLRLVALGRSNSQIATELFVTVGTVKSHVHTISGKLGAANRTEAVARGRELGLLG